MNANNTASRKNKEQICLMARKPCDLKDLKDQIDGKITSTKAAELTGRHKVLTAEFKDWEDYVAADFSASQWWKVTLKKERVELLVNTEGYDYPRYAGILQNI
ncbi:MAG: hypothetical protein PHV82_09260 [Victivallaceae bacterium]|nr:hypothetical protein [Victivallaceae bacterium]